MRKLLIVVDMQNDFIDGSLGTPEAQAIVGNVAEKIKTYPSEDVFATRDTHGPGYLNTQEGRNLPVEHCIEGDWGWNICDGLMEVLDGKCTFVNKTTFGSLDLAEIIREDFPVEEPDEIAVCGYDLSICVVSNALILRAKFPNTRIVVYKDLCGDVSDDAFNSTLDVLRNCQIDVQNKNKENLEVQNKED